MSITNILRQAKRESALLSTKDVADIAGITPWWVRQLIAKGELRAMDLSSGDGRPQWRIDPEDLEAWMRSRENRARDLMTA